MRQRKCNLSQERERAHVQEQVDEDTCEAHGSFCCPVCFDMEPVAEVEVEGERCWNCGAIGGGCCEWGANKEGR